MVAASIAALVIVLLLVRIPATIYTAFLALCALRSIQAQGVSLPRGFGALGQALFLRGLLADVAFNWTWGAFVIFGSPLHPQFCGRTFSSHVQWRVDHGLWDAETATWARFLNAGAPGHIKRVPE